MSIKIKEVKCKSALSKCGFPGGGFCINPYTGCGHGCRYCYARFMKRFTGHKEEWGTFVDVKTNIAEVLEKQIKSKKYRGEIIYIGTVTDPYQPLEKKYRLMRKILGILVNHDNPVSILTKSDMVLRDVDLLKRFNDIDVNFTVNTLDEKWKKLVEPDSPTVRKRLEAMKRLTRKGISVFAMMGPYWPIFTDAEALFREFATAGVKHVFTESLNTIGGNWAGVEKVLKKHYPRLLPIFKEIMFDKNKFYEFYNKAEKNVRHLSRKYKIPATVYFDTGHAGKTN
jgi:DNA repair photolyase